MIKTFAQVLEGVFDRLHYQVTVLLPSILAALIIVAGSYVIAVLARWVLNRIFKGRVMDRFLRTSGLAFMLDKSGRMRATNIVAQTAYWAILLTGVLSGISAFNTDVSTQLTQTFVLLLPRLIIAGGILLTGLWISQYLGRGLLVWAVNEGIPFPRRISAVFRVVVMFVAVVVAAEQLDFARGVFLAAFIIVVGGLVLASSITIGIAGGTGVRRYLEERRPDAPEERGRTLWSHL